MITTRIRGDYLAKIYQDYLTPGERVLDIGCGNGIVSQILIDKLGVNLLGTDIDQYLKKEIPFKLMNRDSILPFKDQEFDYALFNDVLHHTTKIRELIKEAKRVSGKVLIFEMEPGNLNKFVDKTFNWFHRPQMKVPLNFLTKEEWAGLLSELNLEFAILELEKPFYYPLKHLLIEI